jgi:asparagine synthase (glutamine-hydrolysing)
VTALAARELQKNSQPFVACTSVPLHPAEKLFPNRLTDEWPLAHKVAEFYDNIEHILIRADDITPLAAIERSLNITHMPQHAAVNMTWIISLFENARRRNLGVMLTGQLGNGGVSWSGGRDYIFNLFARNQWQKGLGALTAWKKHQGCSWFQALKIQLLRPMLYPLWSAYQQLLLSSPQNDFPVSFISEDFIRRLGMEKTIKVRNPFLGHAKQMDPLTERFLTIIRNGTMVGPLWQAFGAFYNMEVRDPTADVRLIEYCMGVPVEQDTFNGGERMLIRRAMAGIVPDAVRWNTLRGKQAADIIFRLIDQRADVDRQIARFGSIPAINKYISVVAIKHIWNTLCSVSSPRTSSVAVQAFLQVMNVGYFLDAISKKTWGTNH